MTHLNMIPYWNVSEVSNADNVLIAVGFYIGERKKYDGALPFVVVAAITVLAMIISEVNYVILCVQWKGKVQKEHQGFWCPKYTCPHACLRWPHSNICLFILFNTWLKIGQFWAHGAAVQSQNQV